MATDSSTGKDTQDQKQRGDSPPPGAKPKSSDDQRIRKEAEIRNEENKLEDPMDEKFIGKK